MNDDCKDAGGRVEFGTETDAYRDIGVRVESGTETDAYRDIGVRVESGTETEDPRAFLPIGAYAPRYFMSPQHIDPEQAIQTHTNIQSEFSVGIHWGTFQLTHEPFWEPKESLAEALRKIQPEHPFITVKIGQTYSVDLDW